MHLCEACYFILFYFIKIMARMIPDSPNAEYVKLSNSHMFLFFPFSDQAMLKSLATNDHRKHVVVHFSFVLSFISSCNASNNPVNHSCLSSLFM